MGAGFDLAGAGDQDKGQVIADRRFTDPNDMTGFD